MVKINLFSQFIQLLPRDSFRSLLEKYQSDKASKGIDSWTHLVSMLFCHIGQACSVRDIANGLKSSTGNLSHLGIKRAPCKSSLSYMNAHRPWQLYKDYYFELLGHFQRTQAFGRKGLPNIRRKVFLLDASLVSVCLNIFEWAHFQRVKGAVKLHLLLDYDGCLPSFAHVTNGKTHEVNVARGLSFPKGSIVVFDRGYADFEWLNNLDSTGVFFVTRLKENNAYHIISEYEVKPKRGSNVLQDCQIELTGAIASRHYRKTLRMVRFLDSTGREMVFLSNNFQWSSHTIAEIYKQRWHIEVFFKQIKQQLHVKSFIGTSENAVHIQLWTALIAMLLLTVLKLRAEYKWHLSNMITFIRLNLFVKIDLFFWLNKPFYKPMKIPGPPNLFSG